MHDFGELRSAARSVPNLFWETLNLIYEHSVQYTRHLVTLTFLAVYITHAQVLRFNACL